MKYHDPNRVGDIVNVYYDYESEKYLMGSARLRALHSEGRSFILEETMPEIEQKVYNYNTWIVDWILVDYEMVTKYPFRFTRPVNIRYLDAIGITNS